MMQRMLMAVFAIATAATPSFAYLTENHEFTNNLSGWTAESGNWSWFEFDGRFGDGSAQVTSVAGSNSLSQCAIFTLIGEDKGLRFIAFARTVDHTSVVRVSMELYSSADCTGGAIDSSSFENSSPPLDAWSPALDLVTSVPAGPGVNSARLRVTVDSAGGGETTRFDFAALTHNLNFNGDFSDDIDNWGVDTGSWVQIGGDGNSTPLGAVQATIDNSGDAVVFQCPPLFLAPRTPFYFGGAAFKALDTLDDFFLSYQFFSNSDCTPQPFLDNPGVLVDIQQLNTWESFGRSMTPPEGANSVLVIAGTISGTPGSRFLVDSVYFAPPANLHIFNDGFEGGDTSQWTESVP